MRYLLPLLIFSLLFLQADQTFAQAYPAVWKKFIVRTIATHPKGKDSSLSQILLKLALTKKFTAYSTFDESFSQKLIPEQFSLDGCNPDTVAIIDPTTGKKVIKLKSHEVAPNHLRKLAFLEEWIFCPSTGKTEIQILAVGPVRDIYGDENDYRGELVLFWTRFYEAIKIIERYDSLHPDDNIASQILNSYFSPYKNEKAMRDKSTIVQVSAIRTVKISDYNFERHQLVDYSENNSLAELISNEIKAGKLTGYSRIAPKAESLTMTDIEHLFAPAIIDSYLESECPPPCQGEMMYVKRNIEFDQVTTYSIAERYSFNWATGKTTINVIAIAPMVKPLSAKSEAQMEPIFWAFFSTIKDAVAQYEQYSPNNSLLLQIYKSYFQSDQSPVLTR